MICLQYIVGKRITNEYFPAEYMFIDRIAPDHLRVYLPSKKRGLFDLNDDLAL